jgi:hypothetical protein
MIQWFFVDSVVKAFFGLCCEILLLTLYCDSFDICFVTTVITLDFYHSHSFLCMS